MKLIITEEERSRILGMHQNATSREFLMEEKADISPQVEAAYNQILTTLRTKIKTVPTDVAPTESAPLQPVTFGNPIRERMSDVERIFYNVTITIGAKDPETFTVRLGSYINSTDHPKILSAWQTYLIEDFKTAIVNVDTTSRNWKKVKSAILTYLPNIKLATPTQPQKPGVK
jgi:hypothetical protein